jgi:UDP-N-acetylmuramoyl-tripeptide--D-alanyl-D-alanine ligase
MQVVQLGGRTLLDDCYNASPPSVRAALDVLAALGGARRRVAVLGDMLELGPGGPAEHAAIGRYAGERASDVIAVGALSRSIAEGARERLGAHAVHAADHEEAARHALAASQAGDVVLIKGSRGMRLEKVIEAFGALAGAR